MPAPYTTYRAVSFDVFGTLLDWETGFYPCLQPLISQLPPTHPCAAPFPTSPSSSSSSSSSSLAPKHPIFVAFDRHEGKIEAELPKLDHETVLAYAYRDLATELGVQAKPEDVERASASYGSWPAFADTVDALRRLKGRGLKLIALSNVSNRGIRQVLDGPFKDVVFDAVYTAEDIGSYKPALENFEYLLNGVEKDFGVAPSELLHVAHGISSDQLTPEALGIDHVWVERGTDNGKHLMEGNKHLRTVKDMKQLADEIDAAYQ